jgi:hypothetical protein
MSKFVEDDAACCVDSLVAAERDALLRRCVADPRRTPATILWAAGRLLEDPCCGLGPDGEISARSVRVALAHLSAQRHALDTAYGQLIRPRPSPGEILDARVEEVHQAYLELLRSLTEHPDWCCDADGPSAEVARMQLAFRARRRGIDARRRGARLVGVDDIQAFGRAPAAAESDRGLRRLFAYLRGRLPAAEHPKLERFVLHAVLEVPHETIARESGMSHAALRKESSRFAKRVAELLEGYDGDQSV